MKRRYVMGRRLSPQACIAEAGTAERWQHSRRELVEAQGRGVYAVRAQDECALDRWLASGAISMDEHEAGLRLRADYHTGQVPLAAQRVYDGVRGPTPGAAWCSPAERRSEAAERAYQRWRLAIRAVGLRLSPILIAVCCEDGALAFSRRGELRLALQQLVAHYQGKF